MKKIYLICLLSLSAVLYAQSETSPLPPNSSTDENEVHSMVGLDRVPEFPGGVTAFYSIVSAGINKRAYRKAPAGTYKVLITFVIDKEGNMTEETLLKDPGYGMGEEVLRVARTINDKWNPAVKQNKPVRCRYALPVTINIK